MRFAMIQIDGSRGEGGGQILRSSLALSLITGKAFSMVNVRARRIKPGLRPQHLKAVEAAAAIGKARIEGAALNSRSLIFEPSRIRSGEFYFDIGTAGSTSLVLQTILLPLSCAKSESSVTLVGGTHIPWSPCFHYLDLHWLRYLREIGFNISLRLESAGFYPRGGGRVHATIQPVRNLSPLNLVQRGALRKIRGISAVANLDLSVAERQRNEALSRLAGQCQEIEIETVVMSAQYKGTMLLLIAEFDYSQCCYYSLGARGKRAETVADEAAAEIIGFLATDGAVDQYLADQLILPLALAPGTSKLRTSKVTQHLLTNTEVIKMFLPVEIEITGELNQPGLVQITRTGFPS
jgi:RNA 3'-terminal phosphate cyclase (ATP)